MLLLFLIRQVSRVVPSPYQYYYTKPYIHAGCLDPVLLNYSEARTTTSTSNTTKSKSKRRRKASAEAPRSSSKGSRFDGTTTTATVKAVEGRSNRPPRESKDVSAKPRWWIRVQKALYTAATCCVKCLGPV